MYCVCKEPICYLVWLSFFTSVPACISLLLSIYFLKSVLCLLLFVHTFRFVFKDSDCSRPVCFLMLFLVSVDCRRMSAMWVVWSDAPVVNDIGFMCSSMSIVLLCFVLLCCFFLIQSQWINYIAADGRYMPRQFSISTTDMVSEIVHLA